MSSKCILCLTSSSRPKEIQFTKKRKITDLKNVSFAPKMLMYNVFSSNTGDISVVSKDL